MKIVHFMTLDVGTGPVSLVELRHDDHHVMLRIAHRAVFDAVASVDPAATRAYVAGVRGAHYMSDIVSPEHEVRLGDEIARWIEAWGFSTFRIRWEEGRYGRVLATREELEQYDAANAGVAPAIVPRRSERIMA